MLNECLIIFFLLLLNAFFALSEMAIISSRRALLRQWADEGNKRAKVALELSEDSGRFLSTVQVGITLVGILAGAYGGANIADNLSTTLSGIPILAKYAQTIAVIVVVGAITFFSVVIGELVPKQLALKYSEKLAMIVAYPMAFLSRICTPIVIAFEASARLLMLALGVLNANEKQITQAEIKAVISEGLAMGLFEQDENKMLHSVMDLTDVVVEKVMTHRKNIEMLDAALPVDEIVYRALGSSYTRIPLYQDQPENIVGVLHTKLLARQLRTVEEGKPSIDLSAAISEPWFIPETTSLLEQLKVFRERKEHFALVVDEYGSLLGMITREDILEEIVGRMDTENDTHPLVVGGEIPSSFVVDGGKTIRELNREHDWSLPDDAYSTVAGLILYEARALPSVGQSFIFYNFRFDILARQRNQITSVRITPLGPETHTAQPQL